jgi:hypothetical protein
MCIIFRVCCYPTWLFAAAAAAAAAALYYLMSSMCLH